MAKKKSSGSSVRRLLMMLLIGAAVLAYVALGGDIEQLENTLEEYGILEEGSGDSSAVIEEQPPVTGEWYEIYFTNVINSEEEADHTGATVEQALIREIDNAQTSIEAALFELNAPDTTEALIRAVERGVQVRLVLDDEHAFEDPESTAEQVMDAGAQAVNDERSALMHNKFLVIDDQTVWTGSMNLTRNGIYNNNNNAILIRSPALANNYQTEFTEMFENGVFNRRDDEGTLPNRRIEIDGTQIESYFAPESGDELVARIVELIDNAQSSVQVMAFSFTLDEIGGAMISAMDRGLTVEGVIETTGSLRGQLPPLVCAGANMRQDGNPDILHHKVIIIDEEIVVTGSLNFSNSARDNNNENVLIIQNPEIATAYSNEWQARFDQGRVPPEEDIDC